MRSAAGLDPVEGRTTSPHMRCPLDLDAPLVVVDTATDVDFGELARRSRDVLNAAGSMSRHSQVASSS